MKGNKSNEKPNLASKTKPGNKYYKLTKDNDRKWPTKRAAIFQKVATQQTKPN